MALVEALVSMILEELVAFPIDELKEEVRLVMGVKEEVGKLTKNLRAIQAVAVDAERKQLKDESIKVWLADLKEISYEIDDVLDEWRSKILFKSHDDLPTASSSTPSTRKVCPSIIFCCFRFHEIGPRHGIARKIKDLNEQLDEIAKRRKKYNLDVVVSSPLVGVERGELVQQRNTISYVDKKEVKGRATEIEKLTGLLLSTSDDEDAPQIISIVGMGGMGKTTLAQLAYNDDRVKKHFNERIWVCVSDPFDEVNIANAISESIKGDRGTTLQTIVQNITSKIGEKKYLLVLDDVWNEEPNKWNNLRNALMCGLPGSRILVTTRKEAVARIMGCKKPNMLQLGVLSDEECWSIIRNEVESFGWREEDLRQLENIGKQIANKCKGLPLAAKTLGGLLCFKDSREEWQSVLDSEMWQLGEEETKIQSRLFAPLYLSYLDLSSVEKLCLSYCVVFSKDNTYWKLKLVRLWMAQGYLKETKTKDLEMVAEECFRNLSSRSFFQDFHKHSEGEMEFKIHDIVHDFIQYISNKECLSSDQFTDETVKESAKTLRHLKFLEKSMDKFGNSICSFRKLRSLDVTGCRKLDLSTLFNELTCLRSLILAWCDIREIPSTIGRLIHLRYLDISGNDELKELPEAIGELCNLLILNISGCYYLFQCPRGFGKLSNLRCIIMSNGVDLTQDMATLHSIREAKFFVDSEACSLENLSNMNHLRCLDLYLGRQVHHVNGAKKAHLDKKKRLLQMWIDFHAEGDVMEVSKISEEEANRWKDHDEQVIEALQPCSNIEDLKITGCLSANYPSWLMSLQHLRILQLGTWLNCTSLPTLGKLKSLTHLEMWTFRKVKEVGVEFLVIDETLSSDCAFPKLESLEFSGFPEWEEWEMKECSIMPCLATLKVKYCSKLKDIPHLLLEKTTLKELDISGSSLLEERYKKNEGVDWPKISHIPCFTMK